MFRLFLCWLPSLLRQAAGSLACAAPAVVFLALVAVPLAWLVGVGMVCFALPFYAYALQLGRFGKATWRFRTAVEGPLVLRYAPELAGRIDVEHCVKHGNEALAELSGRFGLKELIYPKRTSVW